MSPPSKSQVGYSEILRLEPSSLERRYRENFRLAEGVYPEGVRWSRPEGGFFLWVTLPEGMDADRLLE